MQIRAGYIIIKFIIVSLVFINAVTAGEPVNNFPSLMAPARQDTVHSRLAPDIAAALLSPPDRYGIPADIYFLDDSLLILKTQFESGRNVNTNRGILGTKNGLILVTAGLLLIIIEVSDPTDTWYYGGIPVTAIGAVSAVIGAGSLLVGIHSQASAASDKPEQLLEYFNRRYGRFMNKP